ncbi:MAG: 50S ribosomal protein L7/L12 [uncultured bacterium]|nr:MAG: 50S ribosomal protein L7/L12 [uncultured bacterium]
MDKNSKGVVKNEGELDLEQINQLINSIENSLTDLKKLLFDSNYEKIAKTKLSKHEKNNGKIVEGVFNGEEMIDGNGKHYQVPPNYASKSKLVAGDILKLTVSSDGSFIYKQIGPVDREKIVGQIHEKSGKFQVDANGKVFNVLQASVTFFKAKSGDRVTIVVPKNQECSWAAIENLIN